MSTTRTLSERDETYVGDIVRDENWLVNSSCTLSAPPNTITFQAANKEVLRITPDGHLVIGEGLSAEEATQEAAKLLIASFDEQIQKMVEKRIAAARAEASAKSWEADALLRANNTEFWQARAERAEEQLALKNSQCEHAERAAAGALAERDALAKDKARLDWLEKNWINWPITQNEETIRAAIDATKEGA